MRVRVLARRIGARNAADSRIRVRGSRQRAGALELRIEGRRGAVELADVRTLDVRDRARGHGHVPGRDAFTDLPFRQEASGHQAPAILLDDLPGHPDTSPHSARALPAALAPVHGVMLEPEELQG